MSSNRKAWKWGSFLTTLTACGSRLGFPLLLLFALLLAASPAKAGTDMCSFYPLVDGYHVINGDNFTPLTLPSSIGIDANCLFENFMPPTWPNGLTSTINFKFDGYLAIFNNVHYTGNMACATTTTKIWFVNNSTYDPNNSCQSLFIPVETIGKQSPAATAAIGQPFTYTLTVPVMFDPATDTYYNEPSPNTLTSVTIYDDLTDMRGPFDPLIMGYPATGADVTFVSANLVVGATRTPLVLGANNQTLNDLSALVGHTIQSDTTYPIKHIVLSVDRNPVLATIPAGSQVVIEITVVLDNTLPKNATGATFVNTAQWWFGRVIDGVAHEPLPGQSGVSSIMKIVDPDLTVTKWTPATAINIGDKATYTIRAQNNSYTIVWGATITDNIPTGMCGHDPTAGLSATIVAADGTTVVKTLIPGTDYTLSPLSPIGTGCTFSLTMTDTANSGDSILPTQSLLITYQAQLDTTFIDDGLLLTNVAGATKWFSAASDLVFPYTLPPPPGVSVPRREYDRTLTNGTPGVTDFQDSQTVRAALHGYLFEKSVQNLTSLENPATVAAPGDTLQYKLRVFNVDQNINTVSITDTLNLNDFDPATFSIVSIDTGTTGYNATASFDPTTGLLQIHGQPILNVDVHGQLTVVFNITLKSGLTDGTVVTNQALLIAAGIPNTLSDDPNDSNGSAVQPTDPRDPTDVTIKTPSPLAKANPVKTTATIGERFEYTIAVPATPTTVPLYDVKIMDTLPPNLRFVSARVISGGAWAITNTGTGNSLVLQDTTTGIDIPAKSITYGYSGQAIIGVTVELVNSAANQSSVFFNNTAYYTFNRSNGVISTQLTAPAVTTANMAVTEPLLTAAKTVSFVSPAGKQPTDPATVGDVLEYKMTITNSSGLYSSIAFDTNIADTLPANVVLVPGSAKATINGVAVTGFVATPATPSGNTVVWGRANGDGSLDIPVGGTLVLTYQVTVVDASSVSSFANSAYVDWTSFDGDFPIDPIINPVPGRERTGAGCPAITLPNDYCTGPASVTVNTVDNTSIVKSVYADSYVADTSTTPHILRVGDTVTYDLTLNLQEYTTQTVVVQDVLPAGMAYQSSSIIAGGNFSYTLTQPVSGTTGTLIWGLGNITNTPDGISTDDALVIRYVAQVVTAAPPTGVGYNTSYLLNNQAKLSYTGGDPAVYPARLTTAATIEARQPQMSTITKVDQGTGRIGTGTQTDPYQVNVALDVMKFQLTSCNTGSAPAYNVQITDLLANQLNETSITTPVVAVGGTTLTAGTGYTYTPPTVRGGSMIFVLNNNTPVNPGQCVTVNYNIGFHTDIIPNDLWHNNATLDKYESLPASGRIYASSGPAQVWMTNKVTVQPLTKTLVSPVSPAEATIGDIVTYRITVPGAPMNTELANVQVTDTLNAALAYVPSATATLNGSPLAITTTPSGQTLIFSLGTTTIPAGQQAVITLTARVDNNSSANAGTSVANAASYTYTNIPLSSNTTGTSGPLTIVEPSVTAAKSVSPLVPPIAGDTLHYTVTLTAASGVNYSSAHDLVITDTLSAGLQYVSGTSKINGGPLADPLISGQTLTWSGNINIPEGTTASITYDVRVLGTVVAGQVLTNSVTSQWTSLSGASTYERTGVDGIGGLNHYFTGPVTTQLKVADKNSLTKAIIADTYVDPPSTATDKIARIGDTATYRLTLILAEGTTRSVKVQDVLPTGMAYDSLVSITQSNGSPFTYTTPIPAPGVTGTLTWNLGDVFNAPSNNNTPFDALIIEYKAKVLPDAGIAQAPTANLTNTATLSYLDAGGNIVVDPARLVASDTLLLRQPVMSPITKTGNGAGNTAASPLNVNVANETVHFQLRSCNTSGLAPAYNVHITDLLASQLSVTSITPPVVAVGGTVLSAGTYTYTAPAARGGSMNFVLNTPVNPGQCVTIDYNIGFYTDFGPNQLWNNSATLNEYWSLPAASGQKYATTASSQFYMTNNVSVTPLAKVVLTPTSGELTIGEEAVYQITVPGVPVSAALDNIVVSDTLHNVLSYMSSTVALKNGGPLSVTPSQSGQTLTWNLGNIQAGQQIIITLHARVANNTTAQAGVSLTNTASYTYNGIPAGSTSGTSGQLTIVEPSVTAAKTVANVTQPGAAPGAGEILRYTVTLTAASGVNYSSAYDLVITDTLSAGLQYVSGTSKINGGPLADPLISGQTLTWSGNINIPEGTTASITYDVLVLGTVVAGQVLTNSVISQWTSLAGANSNERTGADGIGGLNDYVTTAAAPPLTVPIPTLTFQKTVDKPVANPGDRLRYTITIQNPTGVRVANFSLVDNADLLNAMPMFQTGSLGVVSYPSPTASYTISGDTLNVTGLNIGPNESLTIVFEAVLMTNLKSGTVVLNQAELYGPWPTPVKSDDPNVAGAANPTQTVIPADGVVYDAVSRKPLGGATLTMRRASTGTDLPASCFIDPSQQNQVTQANGTYKFDLKFDPTNCPEDADYFIAVTAVPAGYVAGPSLVILPTSTNAYSVPVCPGDAIPSTAQCEAQVSTTAPTGAVTTYYMHLTLNSKANQLYNNHIPVDPYVEEKISITKTSSLINVTRGQLVPYTITFKNTLRSTLPPLGIVDTLPPGFKYVEGSSRFDGTPLEPTINGRQLGWNNLDFGYTKQHTIKLLLVVGAGVSEGEYVNRAQVINTDTGGPFSEVATATVRIIPDPTFDCTDIIGKVFDDANANGYPDSDEKGLPGVRIVSARGLIATTDKNGRFHITCAAVPNEDRGSNFILKLDDRTLPTGYRITTENPLVHRLTRGKTMKFNFGATLHRVVRLDIADGVFEPGSTEMRPQWKPRIELLLSELRKAPSLLRISYLADVEDQGVVKARTEAVKREIANRWEQGSYELTIETEIFWRRGGPPARGPVVNDGQ